MIITIKTNGKKAQLRICRFSKIEMCEQTKGKYLEATMEAVTLEDWSEMVSEVARAAMEGGRRERNSAREWLAKYLIGEPSQVSQLLYKEERPFEIVIELDDSEN